MIARNVCSRSDETGAHHQVKSPLTISEIRKQFERVVAIGYKHTRERIESGALDGFRIV